MNRYVGKTVACWFCSRVVLGKITKENPNKTLVLYGKGNGSGYGSITVRSEWIIGTVTLGKND